MVRIFGFRAHFYYKFRRFCSIFHHISCSETKEMLVLNIADFDVYLFDFDGLIVDTEPVYYQAFLKVWQSYGINIHVNFDYYYALASLGRVLFQRHLTARFPQAANGFPQFFEDRERVYAQLIREIPVSFLPGVVEMMEYLHASNKIFGVVTNSSKQHIQHFKKQKPILNSFQFWVTREDYRSPKPAPDSYQYAYQQFASTTTRVIGFEDSLKGLRALAGIPATLVGINAKVSFSSSSHDDLLAHEVFCFPSFHSLLQQQNQR